MTFTFFPDEPRGRIGRKPYKKNPNPANAWIAPEHQKMAMDMQRDFPRDDWGYPLRGQGKVLVVDKRPNILIPPRPTYFNPLVENSS